MSGDLAIGDGGLQAQDPTKRLRIAANQLEGMFIKLLFERVQAGSLADEDGPFAKGAAESQYEQMLHSALSERSAGSMGLADSIFHQLAVKAGLDPRQPRAVATLPSTTEPLSAPQLSPAPEKP